jgi:hypothetical protein
LKLNRFCVFCLIIIVASCNKATFSESDRIIARVHDEHLYLSDIRNLVSPETSASDSLIITQNYINNWVKNQLLLFQAEKNLTTEQKDFSRQLEDYHHSLIIYNYESEFIRQNLDTVIDPEEIEEYYNRFSEKFLLNDNIVKVLFAKVNDDSPYRLKIRELLKSEDEADRDSLEFYCLRYATDYGLVDQEWMTFDEVLSNTSLEIENPEAVLLNTRFIEYHENPGWFYAHILEYGLKDSISPLSLETENISSIILNMRKRQLITKMHEEVYEQAVAEDDFEFY